MKKEKLVKREASKKSKSIKKSIDTEIGETEEEVSVKKRDRTHRNFTCKCGMIVTLEGSIAQDTNIKVCSKCS